MTTHTHSTTATVIGGHSPFGLISWIHARWKRRRDMVRTWRALEALPDFALRDIGIRRSEIGGVANFNRLKDRF